MALVPLCLWFLAFSFTWRAFITKFTLSFRSTQFPFYALRWQKDSPSLDGCSNHSFTPPTFMDILKSWT